MLLSNDLIICEGVTLFGRVVAETATQREFPKGVVSMRVLSGVLAAFVLSASAASAGPLTLSNATGGWDPLSVNADAATAATVSINNQGGSAVDEISWGDADPQSQYDFDPVDGSFD